MIQTLPRHSHHMRISGKKEYSRIISAAVINTNFRKSLLNDPIKTISKGFNGEQFKITSDDKVRLSKIKAFSLVDFAAQLSHVLSQNIPSKKEVPIHTLKRSKP
jgi:hypothetical protein